MRNPLPALLLALLTTGCAARVELETTTAADPPVVVERTAVSLDLLTAPASPALENSETFEPAREPAPPPAPSLGVEEERPALSNQRPVIVVENTVNYDIDVHRHHDTHYHFYEPRQSRESMAVRVEVDQKPERDARCVRLTVKHLTRVKEWEAMFK